MSIYRSIGMVAAIGFLTFAWAGGAAPARAGSVSYLVSVDTTGLAGSSGFLEAQLATAAPPASPSVTATIQNVSTDGVLGAVTVVTGSISGSFTSTPLALANDNGAASPANLSDLQQAFTYGTFLSFVLTLSGSEVNGGGGVPFSGTIFAFLLEDANQGGLNFGPLAGEAFDVYVNPDGSVMVSPNDPYVAGGPVPGFDPANQVSPVVTIAPFSATIPEPSSVVILGLGVAGLVGWSRPRSRPARSR